jgi:hypothetical protein
MRGSGSKFSVQNYDTMTILCPYLESVISELIQKISFVLCYHILCV